MSDRGKLGKFLNEVIHWQWDEFVRAEKDADFTAFEATVFALIRACADGKLGAIKLAIDRVDGKIETPIKYEYPKIYYQFPEAKSVALEPPEDFELPAIEAPESDVTDMEVKPEPEPEVVEEFSEEEMKAKAATLTLRETLEKMAAQKRILVSVILQTKQDVEKNDGSMPEGDIKIPLVKSVIAANLLRLAEKNNFEAITEVFDQIDGKLVETIRILGEDLYLTSYVLEAPFGAEKNKDGVYQIEAPTLEKIWKDKLKRD